MSDLIRYTDFLVNEVTLDGCVVHLTDTNVPRHKATPKVNFKTVLCYIVSIGLTSVPSLPEGVLHQVLRLSLK